MIAEATSGLRSTQASPICAIVNPRSAAIGLSCATAFSKKSYRKCRPAVSMNTFISSLAARLPGGGGCPGAYFPVSTP